jgi:hypothetical protein
MHPPVRRAELVAVAVLVAAGTWLRLVHLGAPSLWWDELVHIRTAEQPDVAAVWHAVRDGVAPGTGNAAAVPLDYLALHAWLGATSAPAPAALERHERTPSAIFSVAALPALWALARTLGGPIAGLTALGLLATAIPHVLYAAEARYYSLYVLATIASLAAFVRVTRAPDRPARWVIFALTNAAFVLSALYGVFPVAAEYLTLGVLLLRRWRRGEGGRPLVMLLSSGTAFAGVLAAYVAPSAVTTIYPRGEPTPLEPLAALLDTLSFVASGNQLVVALALASPLVAWRARRPGAAATLVTVALAMSAVWVIVAVAEWKHYYYHPRHALFLLPMTLLATALGIGVIVDALAARWGAGRRALLELAAGVAVVGCGLPAVRAYVTAPIPFFHQTKTHRDFAGLARVLAARVAALPPDAPYLLLAERNRPGHLANPVLAFYLDTYGLADRVIVRGFGDPQATLAGVLRKCPGGCPDFVGLWFARSLALGDPFDQLPPVRQLLRLRETPWWSGRVGAVGVVVWAPHAPPVTPAGFTRRALDGLALFELRR